MKMTRSLKEKVGWIKLAREAEPTRTRRGSNFIQAKKIGILYRDEDERTYNRIRTFAKSLKEAYHIQTIQVLGFVDAPDKRLPVYQQRKLEYDFLSLSDVSWAFRPIRNVRNFLEHEFDILIDLSGGNQLPLAYVLKRSTSSMKVGWKSSRTESYCDVTIEMGGSVSPDLFIQQLNLYLGNTQIK